MEDKILNIVVVFWMEAGNNCFLPYHYIVPGINSVVHLLASDMLIVKGEWDNEKES